jgi:exosortase
MAEASPSSSQQEPGFLDEIGFFLQWCRRNPVSAVLLAAITGSLTYFFGFLHPFTNGSLSAAIWAWQAWNPEANQEHGKLVPLIALGLIWYHRHEMRLAPKLGENKGFVFVAIGIVLYVLSIRCLQPRMALSAVPFLIYGSVYYLWGRQVARIILFPCVFLIFMIPMAAVEQATFQLQFVITGIVGFLTNILGIGIAAVGTTLTATDGSFNFEIAEGCSGIRSITAMTMLTAVFVHLTQDRLWKKIVIFGCSALFAVIGNVGRIFTVILVAKYYDPKIAGGIYHDYSGYVFFPFALLAMLGMSKLVNIDFKQLATPEPPAGTGGTAGKSGDATQYDY